MLNLAGLTRIEYVFCMPETKDIVIAGPAEGWAPDLSGRVCGIQTGRPIVELQDLIVALRAFPPNGKPTPLIGCSIDPTPEGLQREQDFARANTPRSPADIDGFATGLRNALGLETVTINGVPDTTHFAQVLVEADYRMKLIGIGLEQPRVRIKNYVDRANSNEISKNGLARWYFVPNYECVRVADDEMAMQLVGEGVKLVGADEVVLANGQRSPRPARIWPAKPGAMNSPRATRKIAAVTPIYAQLRNLVDLSVAAAFIQKEDYFSKIGWQMEPVRETKARCPCKPPSLRGKLKRPSMSSGRERHVSTPIGGGVTISPREALVEVEPAARQGRQGRRCPQGNRPQGLAKGQWWWD